MSSVGAKRTTVATSGFAPPPRLPGRPPAPEKTSSGAASMEGGLPAGQPPTGRTAAKAAAPTADGVMCSSLCGGGHVVRESVVRECRERAS